MSSFFEKGKTALKTMLHCSAYIGET